MCPVESTEDSPLPAGRVELNIVASGYIDSGFAIASMEFAQKSLSGLRAPASVGIEGALVPIQARSLMFFK